MNQSALAIRCAGLVKRYGDVTAVDGLDLEVRTGECFGLLGPNGAGKTTTIEILEGLHPHDAGDVEVLGMRWGQHDRRLRQRLGIQLQDTQLHDKLTGEGKTFVDDFQQSEGDKPLEVYTVYAATAAQVLIDAISRSDGSRSDVLAKLFETDLPDTVVGPMSFNEEGDPENASETVYIAQGGKWVYKETKALE